MSPVQDIAQAHSQTALHPSAAILRHPHRDLNLIPREAVAAHIREAAHQAALQAELQEEALAPAEDASIRKNC